MACILSEFSPHWIGTPNDIGLDCQSTGSFTEDDTEGTWKYFSHVEDRLWTWEGTGTQERPTNFGPQCPVDY